MPTAGVGAPVDSPLHPTSSPARAPQMFLDRGFRLPLPTPSAPGTRVASAEKGGIYTQGEGWASWSSSIWGPSRLREGEKEKE